MQKIGILGGGQLGRMLLQAAANHHVETYVLENEDDCPAAHLCHHFTKGNIRDFDAVYQFGKSKIDFKALQCSNRKGENITLSKKEAMLLKLLIENKNEVVTREKILQAAL